ncbi:MAG: hypothetical protein HYX72_05355 [Acidobacteria bacterium]|nr:hypothetical protein [Acidobacteriota bacterium]
MSEDLDSKQTVTDAAGPANPSVDYDPQEVSERLVIRALVIVAAALILALVVCALFYMAMQDPQQKQSVFLPTLQQRVRGLLPPEPRLQSTPGHTISPEQELKQMQRENNEVLSTYGWVDQQHGIAKIPIEEAMKLLVQRGLGPGTHGAHTEHGASESRKEQR